MSILRRRKPISGAVKVWHDLTGREGRREHSQAEISLFRGMEERNCSYAEVHVKAPEELQWGIPLERQVQAGIGRTLTPKKEFGPYPRGSWS